MKHSNYSTPKLGIFTIKERLLKHISKADKTDSSLERTARDSEGSRRVAQTGILKVAQEKDDVRSPLSMRFSETFRPYFESLSLHVP